MFRNLGRTALKIAAVALLATPVLLLTPSCTAECIDKFDCIAKAKRLADGGTEKLTCDQAKCVAGDPNQAPCNLDGGCP